MHEAERQGMNIREKLLVIQSSLKAPKGQYNTFGDYHYRSCEDIQEAVKPFLNELKAVLLLNDELVQIGDRFYIKATAVFQDVESTESICNTAYARECESRPKMDAAQITGSCSSYARKYALNGLFCIDDAKDADTMDNRSITEGTPRNQVQKAKGNAAYITQQHINTIRKEILRTGAQEKAVCYQYKISSLEKMTVQQFKNAMDIFKSMPSKMPDEQQLQMTFDDMDQYMGEMPFR